MMQCVTRLTRNRQSWVWYGSMGSRTYSSSLIVPSSFHSGYALVLRRNQTDKTPEYCLEPDVESI